MDLLLLLLEDSPPAYCTLVCVLSNCLFKPLPPLPLNDSLQEEEQPPPVCGTPGVAPGQQQLGDLVSAVNSLVSQWYLWLT